MTPCEHCQPLILDHLYGLLDGPDAATVDMHLRECPGCAAARDEAARLQGLFAQAAKSAFPMVRFDAPAARTASTVATPALADPMTANSRVKTSRVAAFLPWAVAAAVMLAIPGTVIPVLGVLNRAQTARLEANTSANDVAALLADREQAELAIKEPREAALRDLQAKKQNQELLIRGWVSDEKDNLTATRKSTVDVLKPASFQPGATNELQLVVNDRSATPNGRLLAEIRDQTDAVIFSQPLDTQRQPGEHQSLRLPTSAWAKLTPQSELFLIVSNEDLKTGAKTRLQEPVRLLGPVYATMLVTDKPAYRPGETLFFRSLTLDRTSFRPPDRDQYFEYMLQEQRGGKQIVHGNVSGGTDLVRVTDNNKVTPVVGPDNKPVRGVGCGAFSLPENLSDGDYSLVLRELRHPAGYPAVVPAPVVRPIQIRSSNMDSYQKLAHFSGGSYRPGDVVEGWAGLKLEDKPVSGARVRAFATADNEFFQEVATQPPTTGPDGRASFQFTLPKNLEQGDVRLKVEFSTGNGKDVVVETLAERVPVIGRHVNVEFFPEGGELVAGVPCRVYFRATTPTGQPVDIKGSVTDGRTTLAKAATFTAEVQGANRGIGVFTYTPKLGTPVWLKLESPARIYAPLLGPDQMNFPVAAAALASIPAVSSVNAGFLLPKPASEGVVMSIPDAVSVPGQPIRVHLRSVGKSRTLVVGAYTRGRMSDAPQRVTVEPGELAEVRLMGGNDPRGGVVRVTVFEEGEEGEARLDPKADLKPVAERLVFRKPGESLHLDLSPGGERTVLGGFAPGSTVELNIAASDEKGKPAAAVLYAAALNSGVAPGPKDRLLTTHFLIAGEITTPDAMEYADFLLTDDPKAAIVLDLVLATQGWRRFAEQTPAGYINQPVAPNQERASLLVNNGQYAVWTEPVAVREQRRLHDTYWPRYEAAIKAVTAAQATLAAANADQRNVDHFRELSDKARQANEEACTRADQAKAAAIPVAQFTRAGWYGVAGFSLLATLLGIVLFSHPAGRLPLGISTAGSLGLVAFLLIALGMAEQTQAAGKQKSGDLAAADHNRAEAEEMAIDLDRAIVPPPAAGAASETKMTLGTGSVAPSAPLPPSRGSGGGGLGGRQGFGGDMKVGRQAYSFLQPPPLLPKVEIPLPPTPLAGGSLGGAVPKMSRLAKPGGGDPNPAATGLRAVPLAPTLSKPAPAFGGNMKMMALGAPTQWQSLAGKPTITLDDLKKSENILSRNSNPYRIETGRGGEQAAVQFGMKSYDTSTELARLYVEKRAVKLVEAMDQIVTKPKLVIVTSPDGTAQNVTVNELAPFEMMAYGRIKQTIQRVPPLVVREYAAPRLGSGEGNDLQRDTVLWEPVIVVPSDGKAKLSFHIGSASGGYQVLVAGHTLDGRIGAVRRIIPAAQENGLDRTAAPTPVPPKMP